MKTVTTQKTSKPIKLILFLAFLGIVAGIVAGLAGEPWWMIPLATGAGLWAIGKVLKWIFHE